MANGYRPYVPEQDFLLPPSLRGWLPEGHLAYFVSDVVDQLDLSANHAVYEKEKRGQPPYDPRMMPKLLVYGYCVGQRVTEAANDKEQLKPLVEAIEQQSGKRPASVLGFAAGDRVRAAADELPKLAVPVSEHEAVQAALPDNTQLRRLESSLVAKGYQIKAEIDAERLRTELSSTRSRIVLNAQKSFQDVKKAETAIKVARLDLELARENLGVLLAKMEEGRASLKQVEAARFAR